MEIYLADTPHRRNAQHFGGGFEQLLIQMENGLEIDAHRAVIRVGFHNVSHEIPPFPVRADYGVFRILLPVLPKVSF